MESRSKSGAVGLNQIYGKLTVTGYEGLKKSGKQNYRMFRCLCVCGKEIVTRGSSLKSGNTLSCGCVLKKYQESMRGLDRCKIKPGAKFGRLTALRRVGTRRHGTGVQAVIEFKCACGEITVKLASLVLSGKSLSCGCLRKEVTSRTGSVYGPVNGGKTQPRTPPGLRACRRLMHRYKRDARNRNIDFNLSFQEFASLTSRCCYYCGSAPSFVQQGPEAQIITSYTYNGIDRVDNTLGYTVMNCVACCRFCNTAKNNRTQADFISWVRRVYAQLT